MTDDDTTRAAPAYAVEAFRQTVKARIVTIADLAEYDRQASAQRTPRPFRVHEQTHPTRYCRETGEPLIALQEASDLKHCKGWRWFPAAPWAGLNVGDTFTADANAYFDVIRWDGVDIGERRICLVKGWDAPTPPPTAEPRAESQRRPSGGRVVAPSDADATADLPGIPPPSPTAQAIALERARRAARRGRAPLPHAGLFDEVARSQLELFD